MAFQCYVTIHGHMQGTFQGAGDPGMTQTQHMGSNATQFRAMRPNATQTGANGSNTGWIPVLAFNLRGDGAHPALGQTSTHAGVVC
jgi:hypothetical protein